MMKQAEPLSEIKLSLKGTPGFEYEVRLVAARLAAQMGFSPDRIEDLKTAVAEACTNAAVHGNGGDDDAEVSIVLRPQPHGLMIAVRDEGRDRMPAVPPPPGYPDRRHGWGLYFIHSLMDQVAYRWLPEGGNEIMMTMDLLSSRQ